MVLLPVVERELRVAARGRALYRVRFWSVLVMAGVFAWSMEALAEDQPMSETGEEVLGFLTACAFVFSALIGVIATSDSVSQEKREGTLGLLFLTDLRGYDVICGKLAANSISALYALAASLPILGIPLLMGGVTFVQFAKLALVLLTTMVLSLSVGIFVSTYSRNERKAMFYTFLIMAGMIFLPLFLTILVVSQSKGFARSDEWAGLVFSPGYGAVQTMAPGPAGLPASSYWVSAAWQWLVAGLLVLRACAHVPRSWQEIAVKKRNRFRLRTTKGMSASRSEQGRKWLERNPFLWLAMQGEEASRRGVWLLVGSMLVIWAIAVLKFGMNMVADADSMVTWMVIMNTPLKIWIAAAASQRFSEGRSSNAFELLLSTPLSARQILGGQWLALRKQFGAPLAVVLVWETVMAIHNHHRPFGYYLGTPDDMTSNWPTILLMAADSAALASMGMWAGLRFKGRIRAILASLAVVVFVPVVLIAAVCAASDAGNDVWNFFLLLRALVLDPLVVGWTLLSLRRNFREMAGRT
jgi:ABC-type transport system involved in multi-copper enzyme maturation permease subunit